jgi:hypothetical protein
MAPTPSTYIIGALRLTRLTVEAVKLKLPTESTILVALPLLRALETSFFRVSWLPESQLIPATPFGVTNASNKC